MTDNQRNYDMEHRLKIEIEILGTILAVDHSGGAREIILKHKVSVEDFYSEDHKDLFASILECYKQDAIPTLVAIVQFRPEKYRVNNSKKFTHIMTNILQLAVHTLASLEQHIFMLKQYVLMEFWNRQAHDILYGNWNGRDVLQVGDNVIAEFNSLYKRMTEGVKENNEENYNEELLLKVMNRKEGKRSGVPSTVDVIDDFITSYSPGELYIIAGRPGMGKTTYALITSWEASKLGYPIIFFSLEMPKNQLKSKIISLETGIDYKRIKSGDVTTEELQSIIHYSDFIEKSCFYIEDKVKTIEDISEKLAWYVKEHKVKAAVIDYLQRCKTRAGGKLREIITDISRESKSMAKDNYVPVIALSQLSRKCEERTNKRPILSDLKESGSIEEDADMVGFLYRQAYYDKQLGSPVTVSEEFHTEFIIAKGRDLGTKVIHIIVDAIIMKIYEYSYVSEYSIPAKSNAIPIITIPDKPEIPMQGDLEF